jgi:hypothetical protein
MSIPGSHRCGDSIYHYLSLDRIILTGLISKKDLKNQNLSKIMELIQLNLLNRPIRWIFGVK